MNENRQPISAILKGRVRGISILLIGVIVVSFLSVSCGVEEQSTPQEESMSYNSQLAERLDADTYGMKRYVIAFLKRGPNRDLDSLVAAELQRAHLDNIGRLAEEGKLALAGPFLDDGDLRGIYVFNVSTVEEAAELTATDPAIQTGSLVMELHPWYGSAAVQMISEWHSKISQTDP